MRQKSSSHHIIDAPIPMISRSGGLPGSPNDSLHSSTPSVSIIRSAMCASMIVTLGLEILAGLGLQGFRYFHSARAEMLRRLGRSEEAADAYRRAIELAHDDAERR